MVIKATQPLSGTDAWLGTNPLVQLAVFTVVCYNNLSLMKE